METLAEQIGAFVTMALSPPTMGMGGGSVAGGAVRGEAAEE